MLLLMPGMMLLNLSAIGGIYSWPEVLVRGGGHVVFATIQTIAFLGDLVWVVRFFSAMVLRANQNEAAQV
jgi:hypothetical protein